MYTPTVDTEDEQSAEHARQLAALMPYSVIGSVDDVTTPDGRVVRGRQYLWGVAEGKSPTLARAGVSLTLVQWRTTCTATLRSCGDC